MTAPPNAERRPQGRAAPVDDQHAGSSTDRQAERTPHVCARCGDAVQPVRSWATGRRSWHDATELDRPHACTIGALVVLVVSDGVELTVVPGDDDALRAARRVLRGRLSGPLGAAPGVLGSLARGGVVAIVPAPLLARTRLHQPSGRPSRSRQAEHAHELDRLRAGGVGA